MQLHDLAAASVLARVATVTGLPAAVITGPRRTQRVAYARFLAVWMLHRELPNWTNEDIALAVGARDPGMAHHALRRVPELAEQDNEFRVMLAELECEPRQQPAALTRISPDLVADILAATDIAARSTTPAWLLAAADSLEQAARRIRTELATPA